MKKTLFSITLCVFLSLSLSSCMEVPHIYQEGGTSWILDEKGNSDTGLDGGEEATSEHEHTWSNGTITTEPTCTEKGVMTYVCLECGETKTEDLPANGHSPSDEWTLTTAPTCTSKGVETNYCMVCNEALETREVAELDHDFTNGEYGTNETQHWKVCPDCGAIDVAEDHTFNSGIVTTPATCEEEGVLTKTCTVCGYEKEETIASSGHSYGDYTYDTEDEDKAASGHYKVCISCGETTEIEEHDFTNGYSQIEGDETNHTKTCSICGYSVSEEHSYNEGVVTKEASHSEAGEITYTCTKCGYIKTEEIPIVAHTESEDYKYDETNPEAGHYKYCTECGELIGEAIEHTFATLTDNSNGTHTKTCECGYSVTESHDLTYQYVDENTHSVYCASGCGYTISESHSYSSLTGACACGYNPEIGYAISLVEGGEGISIDGLGSHQLEADGSLVLPSSYKGYDVTVISDSAFQDNTDITSVTIPDTVTTIENGAFYGCSNLKEVKFGEDPSIKEIGYYSFRDCTSLEEFIMPDTVTTLHSQAFYFTYKDTSSLKEVHLSTQLTRLYSSLFYNCTSLTTVNMPIGLTHIEESVFYNCTSLSGEIAIPGSVTSLGDNVFYNCSSITSITFESDSNLATIGTGVFQGTSSLKSIVLPQSVTSIGDSAFVSNASIESVTFSGTSQLQSIGKSCFSECTSLTDFDIPSTVTTIGQKALYHCTSLDHVTIPSGVTTIEQRVFEEMPITSLIIPDTVTTFVSASAAFFNCTKLKWVVIGSGISEITNMTFYGVTATFYYHGDSTAWSGVTVTNPGNNGSLNNATPYFYSDEEVSGCWHYVDGVPTLYS